MRDLSAHAARSQQQYGTSRRVVLCAFAATGLATTLSACGGDGDGNATDVKDTAGTSTTGGTPRTPLADIAQIPVGGGKLVEQILLVQPQPGTVLAFSAICPHRGARISPPQDGVITCYEHMSTFRDTDGTRLGGPAPQGLAPVDIIVEGTTVYSA